MSKNLEKTVKMWNTLDKTVKNVQKQGKNRQRY